MPEARLEFEVAIPEPHTHRLSVTLTVRFPGALARGEHLDLMMPAWTPGSYVIRDYARFVSHVRCKGIRSEKIDKQTWRLHCPRRGWPASVTLAYEVYANELSVQGAHVDGTHANFNGAAVFLVPPRSPETPATVRVRAPSGWRVATGMPPARGRRDAFLARDVHHLLDCPFEVGPHRELAFSVRGVRHRVVFWGHGNEDRARVVRDLARVAREEARMFGGFPYDAYVFIILLAERGGGGLEHENSTVLQVDRFAFEPRERYEEFLGLAAHELFHAWNVKRVRPIVFDEYDYAREQYTRLLWVHEGLTSYYDALVLARAGLTTEKAYFEYLAKTIKRLEDTPGRKRMTLEESSFDTWVKLYKPHEGSVNENVSYYLKGELVGLALDLEIRRRSRGRRGLDDVMRGLYVDWRRRRAGIPEDGFLRMCERVTGLRLGGFFRRYVSGLEEIPFERFLARVGCTLRREREERKEKALFVGTASPGRGRDDGKRPAGALGVRFRKDPGRAVVDVVLAGTAAWKHGIYAGDEIVAVEGCRVDDTTVAQRVGEHPPAARVVVHVFRRNELLAVPVVLGEKPYDKYVLEPRKRMPAAARRLLRGWLRTRP